MHYKTNQGTLQSNFISTCNYYIITNCNVFMMTGSIYYYDQLYKQNIDWFCFIVVQTFMFRNIYVNFIENHNTSLKIVIVDGFILSIKRHLQFSHHYFIIIFVSVSTKPTRAYCMSNFYRGKHFVISPVFQCYKTWIRYFFLFLKFHLNLYM